jgi:hypothetical protein
VWGRAPREGRDQRCVGVVLGPTRRSGLHRVAVDLGPRLLAPQSGGAARELPAPPAGQAGAIGVRRVIGHVPSRRPWLPASAPTWVPGQRAVSEADRRRRADALEARVDAYDGGQREAHLVMPKKVA